MDIIKLKDHNNLYVYPVSHTSAIKVEGEQKTLTTKLGEITLSIDNIDATNVDYDNSQSGFVSTDVQHAIDELAFYLEDIEQDYTISDSDDTILITDDSNNEVVEITSNGVDAKNLKSNGIAVATVNDITTLATKAEILDKQDKIDNIVEDEQTIIVPVIEFRDDENNYVGEVSPLAIAAKKFLIKTSPSDAGTDITDIAGSTSIAKTFGLSDIIHVIGYGQSQMAGSSSGAPVTTTQNRSNLFRFAGGVRPYDVFDCDTSKRIAIKRQDNVNPSYLEMSDNKDTCLEASDVAKIENSVGSLVPLTEQRINYVQNQDGTYSPTNSGGTYDARHGDGETPLSGFCEGLLNSLEVLYGNNFGFDMIATCCAYGSADFPSLLPFDREGRTHNPSISDGSNMNYFEVLLMTVKAAKAIADAASKSYSVDVVVYMESSTAMPNVSGVTITNTMRAYRIAQLFTLINQRVKEITKQSNDIIFLCDQSKTYANQREALRILGVEKLITLTSTEQNALDTLNSCYIEPYDLNKIYLVTSANNYPIRKGYDVSDNGGDRIHHPAVVHKYKGATIGEAYAKIMTGKEFKPLCPINVKVINNDIFIKYHVPVSPIVIDIDAVNGNTNLIHADYMNGRGKYGFGLFDSIKYKFYLNSVKTVNNGDQYEYQVTANSKKTYTVISSSVDSVTGNTVVFMSGSSQYDTFTSLVGGTTLTKKNGSVDDSLTFTNVSEESYVENGITAVEVVEADTIKISCSGSPAGKTLEYCYKPMPNDYVDSSGPTNSEFGNIRDSLGDVSKITVNNVDYPLHNWSIGFSKQL